MPLSDQSNPISPRAREAWERLFPDDADRAVPPGGFSVGTSLIGGPLYTDAFQSKRGPTPWELVEAYKSIVYACVTNNISAVTRLPLRLYANTSKGKRASDASGPRSITPDTHKHIRSLPYCRSLSNRVDDIQEITNHPLIDVLDDPAVVEDQKGFVSYFSREVWLGLIIAATDIIGTHYVKPDGPAGRPPQYLWPLLSQYVIPQPMPSSPAIGMLTYFAETYYPSELLWFRSITPSLRDSYKTGFSPTYAGISYERLEDTFVAIQNQVMANGARPNLLVSAKDPTMPPGDTERRRLDIDLQRTQAQGNAGRHIVTTGAFDFTPLNYPPTDLAAKEVGEYDFHRICNIFGNPISMFSTDTNLANLEAAERQHAKLAVEPRCLMIAGRLTQLARQFDPRLFWAFDPALTEDEEKKARTNQIYLNTGVRTINQVNEETPYPPVPWGDEPWLPGTLVQPTMAQERHESGLKTAEAMSQAKADDQKSTTKQADEDAGKAKAVGKDKAKDDESRSADLDGLILRTIAAVEAELKGLKS